MYKDQKALAYVGPSFEELTDEQMLNIDGEITPTVIVSTVVKVTCSALVGSAVTVLIKG